MKKFLITLLILGSVAVANANPTSKEGAIFCMTKDSLTQFLRAISTRDEMAVNYLLENSCVIMHVGAKLTILKRTWGGVKARVYGNNTTIMIWTTNNGINQD